MKIALVRPSYSSYIFVPPLGLGYICSYLKKFHQEVKIIDGIRDNLSPSDILNKINDFKPDVVGISCLTPFYEETKKISLLIKEAGYKIVWGGPHPTFMPYQCLTEAGADYVMCGEGELAWRDLTLSKFENSTSIQGVYDKNSFTEEPKGHLFCKIIENLDEIPFPDWEELNIKKYQHMPHGVLAKNFPNAPITMSRGCAYNCTFCSSPVFYQHKIRYRSPENVIAEIEYLIKTFKIKEFHTVDDNLIYDLDFATKFCNLLIEKNIKIPWTCVNGIRADKLNLNIAKLLKKAGCYMVAIGIESANPQILKNIRKGETFEQIDSAIKIAHQVGIEVQGNFILGLPGETKETLEETIKYTKTSKVERANINILQILPGSKLFYDIKNKSAVQLTSSSPTSCYFEQSTISNEEIEKALPRAIQGFWLNPRIFFNTLKYIKIEQITIICKRLADFHFFDKIINLFKQK